MSYRIEITPSAARALEALPSHIQRQINARILALSDNPRPPGMKALKGKHKGLCRIRQGDYRIIYQIQDAQRVVLIVKIADRKDSYD